MFTQINFAAASIAGPSGSAKPPERRQGSPSAAASPPDVRRGFAPPTECNNTMGYARGSGSAPKFLGRRPNQGHSPTDWEKLTARQSLASHQAAKPQCLAPKISSENFAVTNQRDVLQLTPDNIFHPRINWQDVRAKLPGKASVTRAVPKVCVSFAPAQLLKSLAEPVSAPVAGMSHLWVSNTGHEMFRYKAAGASSSHAATRRFQNFHLRSRVLSSVTLTRDDDDVWITFPAFTGFAGMVIAWGCAVWGTRWRYSSYFSCAESQPALLRNPPTYGFTAWYDPYTGTFGRGAAVYGPYGGAGGFAAYDPRTGTYARGGAVYGPYVSNTQARS